MADVDRNQAEVEIEVEVRAEILQDLSRQTAFVYALLEEHIWRLSLDLVRFTFSIEEEYAQSEQIFPLMSAEDQSNTEGVPMFCYEHQLPGVDIYHEVTPWRGPDHVTVVLSGVNDQLLLGCFLARRSAGQTFELGSGLVGVASRFREIVGMMTPEEFVGRQSRKLSHELLLNMTW